jgi:hypothetical protein
VVSYSYLEDLIQSTLLVVFLLIVSTIIFVISYCGAYVLCKATISSFRQRAIILKGSLSGLPVGFTGLIAGVLTGLSRSPAVSALVPAILTFVGLVVVYMIDKGRVRAILTDFTVFLFSANLIVGTSLGSASRDRYEEHLASITFREFRADQEFKVRLYCKGLGLISDVSKPCPLELSQEKPGHPENP